MGRDSYSSRRIVEYSYGISISDLLDRHLLKVESLQAYWKNTITEKRNNESKKLAEVSYQISVENPNDDEVDGVLSFEWTYLKKKYSDYTEILRQHVNLGGFRYFFRCRHCGRRVKKVFFGGNAFACRHCCKLVYHACRNHRNVCGLIEQAETTEKKSERLRASNHPRLANRLQEKSFDQMLRGEEALDEATMKRFGHLV